MTSMDRTAYPTFKRMASRDLTEAFTPFDDEVAWARERSSTDSHLLALVVWWKSLEAIELAAQTKDNPADLINVALDVLVKRERLEHMRWLDSFGPMFCKRMAIIDRKGKDRREELREQHREKSERLLEVFGDVLAAARDAAGSAEPAPMPGTVSAELDSGILHAGR